MRPAARDRWDDGMTPEESTVGAEAVEAVCSFASRVVPDEKKSARPEEKQNPDATLKTSAARDRPRASQHPREGKDVQIQFTHVQTVLLLVCVAASRDARQCVGSIHATPIGQGSSVGEMPSTTGFRPPSPRRKKTPGGSARRSVAKPGRCRDERVQGKKESAKQEITTRTRRGRRTGHTQPGRGVGGGVARRAAVQPTGAPSAASRVGAWQSETILAKLRTTSVGTWSQSSDRV